MSAELEAWRKAQTALGRYFASAIVGGSSIGRREVRELRKKRDEAYAALSPADRAIADAERDPATARVREETQDEH